MPKANKSWRYQVGYNKPIEGAFGDSPQEFHLVGEFDDLVSAVAEVGQLREKSGDDWGKKSFIFDTLGGTLIELVCGSDGKLYFADDPKIPG